MALDARASLPARLRLAGLLVCIGIALMAAVALVIPVGLVEPAQRASGLRMVGQGLGFFVGLAVAVVLVAGTRTVSSVTLAISFSVAATLVGAAAAWTRPPGADAARWPKTEIERGVASCMRRALGEPACRCLMLELEKRIPWGHAAEFLASLQRTEKSSIEVMHQAQEACQMIPTPPPPPTEAAVPSEPVPSAAIASADPPASAVHRPAWRRTKRHRNRARGKRRTVSCTPCLDRRA
jgi:hypothetical protein